MSYRELAVADGGLELYALGGMEIYENVAAMTAPKYAEAAAKRPRDDGSLTLGNNMVARMQAAGNTEGISRWPSRCLAGLGIRRTPWPSRCACRSILDAKDYAQGGVELAPEAAEAQPPEEDKSLVYLMLRCGLQRPAR